jgi:hypothetical protein
MKNKRMMEGSPDLAGYDKDSIIAEFDRSKKITDYEFGDFINICIDEPYYRHAEYSKQFYGRYSKKVSKSAKYILAKYRLFSWFMRSLFASQLSVKHPSYGTYCAVMISHDMFDDDELTQKLIKEFGDKPADGDKYMPDGSSYWDCN